MSSTLRQFLELPFTNAYVAGGAVLSRVTKTPVADYDIYPKSLSGALEVIAVIMSDMGGQIVSVSDRAVTFKVKEVTNQLGERAVVQVMMFDRAFTVESIFNYFDYTVCMGAYDLDTKKYIFHENFWEDVASRTLRFNKNTRYPLNSLVRTIKYQKKGYTLPASQAISIALRMTEEKITSWDDLASAIGGTYGKVVTSRSFFTNLPPDAPQPDFSLNLAMEILHTIPELQPSGVMPSKKITDAIARVTKNIPENFDLENLFYVHDHIVDMETRNLVQGLTKTDMINTGFFKDEDFKAYEGTVVGYKVLAEKDGKLVNASWASKKINFTVGDTTSEEMEPHIFVYYSPEQAGHLRMAGQALYKVLVHSSTIIDPSKRTTHDSSSVHFRTSRVYVAEKVETKKE